MLWLPAYVRRRWAGRRESPRAGEPVHVMFCIADHFEPALANAPLEEERRRVQIWLDHYPAFAEQFTDADGCHPRHTFFFPAEEYRAEHLDGLAQLVAAGHAEVEVHLHHDKDTAEGLRQKLMDFTHRLRRHGLIGTDRQTGDGRFGFVHGNWALDNSLPDGRWCGVNNELQVLRECGCYADFTFPSAPSATQPRRINSIYYATDDPERPRSHDDGDEVRVGGAPSGDLMIVEGPLTIMWPGGRLWVLPRLENASLAGGMPFTPARVAAWVRTRVCVQGRPDWVFVKVHTHGCNEANTRALLGAHMANVHRCLTESYNDAAAYRLHYVTARELYNIVKAAESGLTGNPGQYRDYLILPPAAARVSTP